MESYVVPFNTAQILEGSEKTWGIALTIFGED